MLAEGELNVAAIFAAVGAITSAVVGLAIVVRNLRSQSRKQALDEADELEVLLADCRHERLDDQRRIFELEQQVARPT